MRHHSSPTLTCTLFARRNRYEPTYPIAFHAQLTACDFKAFVAHANALNQRHRETFTTPFPKVPGRWLSHYQFTPRPIALTTEGNVDGGFSWLVGATLDLSFTRSMREFSHQPRMCVRPKWASAMAYRTASLACVGQSDGSGMLGRHILFIAFPL